MSEDRNSTDTATNKAPTGSRSDFDFTEPMEVFLDSGCVFGFFPIGSTDYKKIQGLQQEDRPIGWWSIKDMQDTSESITVTSWQEGMIDTRGGCQGEDASSGVLGSNENNDNEEGACKFLRYRFTKKKYGNIVENVYGLEIAIETNSGRDEGKDDDHPGGFYYPNPEYNSDLEKKQDARNKKAWPEKPYCFYNAGETISFTFFGAWQNKTQFRCSGKIHFKNRKTSKPLPADLIVDIGNTRTIAMLIKYLGNDQAVNGGGMNVEAISNCCRPVMLSLDDRGRAVTPADFNNIVNGIVSSWFLLHETEFSTFEKEDNNKNQLVQRIPPKEPKLSWLEWLIRWFKPKKYGQERKEECKIPAMFARISPVVIGESADNYLNKAKVVSLMEPNEVQQSSPKRYFSDCSQKKESGFWKMIPNDLDLIKDTLAEAPMLAANVLYWINEYGEFADRDVLKTRSSSCPRRCIEAGAIYPRSATLVWMLVAILERAWSQCNLDPNKKNLFNQYILREVTITYPSGWTCDEIESYKERCETAVKIFERCTFGTKKQINVNMCVDEAVASQIPYVFSEIHRLGDNAENWIRLTGRKRGEEKSVRVMSLDIGGGTSDVSIVEYTCERAGRDNQRLKPKLIFKDGIPVAGDELLRQVIIEVVFATLGGVTITTTKDGEAHCARTLLNEKFSGKDKSKSSSNISLHIKRCLVPIALAVMKAEDGIQLEIVKKGGENDKGIITNDNWNAFGKFLLPPGMTLAEPNWEEATIKVSRKDVKAIIERLFRKCLLECSKLVARHEVDVFFVSGKTSETPELEELVTDLIPLVRNRIVPARKYVVGKWYPFSDDEGHVSDAKSVTVVGAAIHHMLSEKEERRIAGLQIAELETASAETHAWGRFVDMIRNPKENKGETWRDNTIEMKKLRHDDRIGKRQSLSGGVEPVYRFVNKNDPADDKDHIVKFRRKVSRGSEGLDIVSVDGKPSTDYKLVVDQLDSREWEFWQDSGRLIF